MFTESLFTNRAPATVYIELRTGRLEVDAHLEVSEVVHAVKA